MSPKWLQPIRACGCLNIRVNGLTSSFVRFEVVYPFLADLVLQQGDPPAYYLVCLVCRKAVLQNSFRAWHTDEIAYESDPNTGRHYLTVPYSRRVATRNYALLTNGSENQAGFSRTLRLIVPNPPFDPTEFEVGLPNELKYLNFDIRKEELAFIASSLVGASIKNALGAQVSALKASSSPKAAYSAFASNAAKVRHDIETLCGVMWSQYHKPAIPSIFHQFGRRIGIHPIATPAPSLPPPVPKVAKDFAVPYLESITELKMSIPNVDSRIPSAPPLTLVDLPIETCWRILEFLEIEHIPGDPMVVQDYIHQRAQLARMATISKGFAQIIIPILYRHIIIFAEPISVEKLSRALGTYKDLVKRLTVDDVPLGDRYPDVHIRTCRAYIEKCVRACEGLVSVECFGDYQLFASSRIPPPSSTSSTSSSRSSTPDSDTPDTPVYRVPKTIQSMVIGCPTWLPLNISFELRYVQHHLTDLAIINWGSQDLLPYVHIKVKLPKLRSLCLKGGFIPEYVVQDLLMTTFVDDDDKEEYSGVCGDDEDRTGLRELSLLDLTALNEPSILHLLAFRNIGQQLTTLRIGLSFHVQRETKDDFPLKVLGLCPRLEDFTYLSPCSVKVFDMLPKTIRRLELAVFVVPYSQIMKPLDGTVLRYEEFVPFVRKRGVGCSRRSGNDHSAERTLAADFGRLEELTIVRRFCHDGTRLSYDPPGAMSLRLNVWQQQLGCRELEDACRKAGVSLKYDKFRMNLTATRGYGT